MMIGLGLGINQLQRRADPFTSLISTLLSGASQVIAHPAIYGNMFQDRAGTAPVTESGQSVGLALDWGLTGKKPVPGPDIASGINDAANWTGVGTNTVENDGGVKVSYVDSNNGAYIAIDDNTDNAFTEAPQIGTYYVLKFSLTVGQGSANITAPNLGSSYTAGEYEIECRVILSDARFLQIKFIPSSAGDNFTIDNISVRELPGYHATAISDAARGIFRDVAGKRWIEYNGVNTAYATPALPAPGVDKVQVFAGVRKLSDDARGVVVGLSASAASNNGSFVMTAPDAASATFAFESKGTTLVSAVDTGIAAPAARVLTGLGDISGDLATLRIDGTQEAQNTGDQGTGNYLSYPLYSGGRAGTSVFTEMDHFATLMPIVRFSAANATADQIAAAEAYYTARVV